MTQVRNSNHELLRLISMYMIVFIHANMHLGLFVKGSTFEIYNSIVNGICNTGVTLFILISGYYGIKFSIKKLVKLECLMVSLSLVEFVLIFIFMRETMTNAELLKQLVKSVLPFITRKYWFYSSYVCLMIFSPYINKLADSLEKKEYKRLLACFVVIFSVFPTIFYFEIMQDTGKGVVQMLMVYLIGRYLKLHVDCQEICRDNKGKLVALMVGLWLINGLSHAFPIVYGDVYHVLTKDNSITNIVLAVVIFILFSNVHLQSRTVNAVSRQLFSVFALEYNAIVIIMFLLKEKIRAMFEHTANPLGFLAMMIFVLSIMLLTMLIGLVRNLLLGWLDNIIADFISKKSIEKDLFKK